MSQVIRLAIAGQGRSGYGIHANYLKRDADFKIVAVADELPERREQAAREFGCQVYSNALELLEKAPEFDLFVNATPSRFHVEVTLAAMKRAKIIVMEKPSAPTVAVFDHLVEEAKKANVRLYPFQNSRFFPFFTKMREVINSGILGDIV